MNNSFNKKLKIGLSSMLIIGFSIIGLGIGLLLNKELEVFLISFGLGLITIVIFLIKIEYDKY